MKRILVAGRIPEAHAIKLDQIGEETGKCQSDLVREAIAQYLGEVEPDSVIKMSKRIGSLERQISKLQKLVLSSDDA